MIPSILATTRLIPDLISVDTILLVGVLGLLVLAVVELGELRRDLCRSNRAATPSAWSADPTYSAISASHRITDDAIETERQIFDTIRGT